MTDSQVFDKRVCALGEGPLWHPLRKQLFWFDILGKKMLSQKDGKQLEWAFEDHVSAAGWIDADTLMIASERALFRFDLTDGSQSDIAPLEHDNAITRSNDGRADPWGGFWIGTMGKKAEQGAGSIYRYYDGALRKLHSGLTVTNSICFAPDRSCAYFTDTHSRQIMRQALDADDGWPNDKPEVFIDLTSTDLNPDGSVVDAEGCLWNAQWGASRVARYSPDGALMSTYAFPPVQTSCPAFGGDDLQTLFVTSAAISQTGTADGQTFHLPTDTRGQPEHQVVLNP